MDDLYLIYVHLIGVTHDNNYIYEFVFSEDKTNINYKEWNWLETPIAGNVIPPEKGFYDKTCRVELKKYKLILLEHMSSIDFKYLDAFDDVIALAWEDDEDNDELNSSINVVKRLVFRYGDTYQEVKDKFYSRDIIFN